MTNKYKSVSTYLLAHIEDIETENVKLKRKLDCTWADNISLGATNNALLDERKATLDGLNILIKSFPIHHFYYEQIGRGFRIGTEYLYEYKNPEEFKKLCALLGIDPDLVMKDGDDIIVTPITEETEETKEEEEENE